MFSGSYNRADVTILLKPTRIAPTSLEEKEQLIQSGKRHYSEMLGEEYPPTAAYLELFHDAVRREGNRMARHATTLAAMIGEARPNAVTVVSLARAGTPVGVLLNRALSAIGRETHHYSISVIRDRGLDATALAHILNSHAPQTVVFVDGWTAKGVIAAELRQSVDAFNRANGVQIDPGLYVLTDLCGAAAASASDEDYLVPSSLLGATVSGLISRSVLNRDLVGDNDFHACAYYEHLKSDDLSNWFVDTIWVLMQRHLPSLSHRSISARHPVSSTQLRQDAQQRFAARLNLVSPVYLKPGIGEATRALLRRVPGRLYLRDPNAIATAHLRLLAQEKGVPVTVESDLPYQAAVTIREVTN